MKEKRSNNWWYKSTNDSVISSAIQIMPVGSKKEVPETVIWATLALWHLQFGSDVKVSIGLREVLGVSGIEVRNKDRWDNRDDNRKV